MEETAHITWRPVSSSNVACVGWPMYNNQALVEAQLNPEPGVIFDPKITLVMFKDGRVYGYIGASRQRAIYMATRCSSVGRYVNCVLKKRFTVVRIPELDAVGPPF